MITLLHNHWLLVQAGALTPSGNTWLLGVAPLQGQSDITLTHREVVALIRAKFLNHCVIFDPGGWGQARKDGITTRCINFVVVKQPAPDPMWVD